MVKSISTVVDESHSETVKNFRDATEVIYEGKDVSLMDAYHALSANLRESSKKPNFYDVITNLNQQFDKKESKTPESKISKRNYIPYSEAASMIKSYHDSGVSDNAYKQRIAYWVKQEEIQGRGKGRNRKVKREDVEKLIKSGKLIVK